MSIRAGVWHAPLAAYGCVVDVSEVDGGWEIGPMRLAWIS